MRRKTGRQHTVDLTGGVAAAANLDADGSRCYQARGKLLFGAAVTEGEIAICVGGNFEGGVDGKVERVGKSVKYRGALAEAQPLATGALDRADTAKHNNCQFVGAGFTAVFFALFHLARFEGEKLIPEIFNAVPKYIRADQ
jgi:hypothetical protein